ncbi:GGDEF domain-containing protein [Streptacidiphilus sp. 4-A2]|nr:GGDEF domain-containing protein [Streptacidiphilus sp. 4-A2]
MTSSPRSAARAARGRAAAPRAAPVAGRGRRPCRCSAAGDRGAAGARDSLERTSYTDPLTGVWNYRYLQLSLDREIARCLRHPHRPGGAPGGQLALLLLEVEGFEEIRREHGYRRGGAVLRDLAQRLAMEFRETDVFGRYGGEEFLVLLPDTDAAGAQQAAERLGLDGPPALAAAARRPRRPAGHNRRRRRLPR